MSPLACRSATALVALLPTLLAAVPAAAQPRPVERVSIRADLFVEESLRRANRDGWTVRHDGPWLHANDEWTNAAGVSYFPANTAYWVVAVVDECAPCDFEVRFFDEEVGGYFPLDRILDVRSDGGMMTATGWFEVERDTRGELYLQMTVGSELYPTYLILAQVR